MTPKQTISTDEMLCRTLTAFLEAQAKAYEEGMGEDEPTIANVQARYETAALALATLARFCTRIGSKDQLPNTWEGPVSALHDLICETGDEYLRSKGVEVPT